MKIPDTLKNLMAQNGSEPGSELSHTCDTCGGAGYIYAGEDDYLSPCPHCAKGQGYRQQIEQNRFRACELPADYAPANLATWLETAKSSRGKIMAYAAAQLFVANQGTINAGSIAKRAILLAGQPRSEQEAQMMQKLQQVADGQHPTRNWLVLYGTLGTGKTWLMAAMVNALRENGEAVLFLRLSEALQSLSSTWRQDSDENQNDLISRYREAPYLCVDDFNLLHDPYGWQMDFVLDIVRYRYNRSLPTILTTNHDRESFSEQWGKQTADPVSAKAEWIRVGGEKERRTEQALEELEL